MAKVIITIALREEIFRHFKSDSEDIILRMMALESHPAQGKAVGHISGVVIKELKLGTYRFYFITDGYILKFGSPQDLAMLLIKFVRMSEKKDQQRAINEIKLVLKSLGMEGF